MKNDDYIAVVGGANIDIQGLPYDRLVHYDSNPGRVRFSMGGVGRNVANNLSLLGVNTRFITTFAMDMYADQLKKSCHRLGIDISECINIIGSNTSTYIYITNDKGDMELAISDMTIYNHMTPSFLEERIEIINNACLCVMDTNIPVETVRYLAENCTCPLFVDTVSTIKSLKIKDILHKIHTLKPNRLEATELTGIQINEKDDWRRAADKLLEMGVKRVFITMGELGAYMQDGNESHYMPCYSSNIVNANGVGDSFMSAVAWAFTKNLSNQDALKVGVAASSICISGRDTVNPVMSVEDILSISGVTLKD